jgi:hypothetical protein
MEADVVWKAAIKPRLPTPLGKRFAFPTAPTAPATGESQARRTERDSEANLQNLTYTTASLRRLRMTRGVCHPERSRGIPSARARAVRFSRGSRAESAG